MYSKKFLFKKYLYFCNNKTILTTFKVNLSARRGKQNII